MPSQNFFGTLQLQTSDGISIGYNLTDHHTNIGKFQSDCKIHIDHPKISGIHCSISYQKDDHFVAITNHSDEEILISDKKIIKYESTLLRNDETITLWNNADSLELPPLKFVYQSNKNYLKRKQPEKEFDTNGEKSKKDGKDDKRLEKYKESQLKSKTDEFFEGLKDDAKDESIKKTKGKKKKSKAVKTKSSYKRKNIYTYIGDDDGFLLEYNIYTKKTSFNYGRTGVQVSAITTSPDRKYVFYTDAFGALYEFDIAAHKNSGQKSPPGCNFEPKLWPNSKFKVKEGIDLILVSNDNNFFITASNLNYKIRKWSMQTRKLLHTWTSQINASMTVISCSHNSKYLSIGYNYGELVVYDLKNNAILQTLEIFEELCISSIIFGKNDQSAYISDETEGWVKKLDMGNFTYLELFETEHPIFSICLTDDEEHLLVGQRDYFSVYSLEDGTLVKEIDLYDQELEIEIANDCDYGWGTNEEQGSCIIKIELIREGEQAVVVEGNGNITIIGMDGFEIVEESEIHGPVIWGCELLAFAVL